MIKQYGADKGVVADAVASRRLRGHACGGDRLMLRRRMPITHSARTLARRQPGGRQSALGLRMSLLPRGKALASSARRPRSTQRAAASVLLVDRTFSQPAAFERLEGGGEGGSVHGEQARGCRKSAVRPVSDISNENCMRQLERPERVIKAARQARPRDARAGRGSCRAPDAARRGRSRAVNAIILFDINCISVNKPDP